MRSTPRTRLVAVTAAAAGIALLALIAIVIRLDLLHVRRQPVLTQDWKLTFADEFDGGLNASRWSTCYYFAEVINGQLTCALETDKDTFVDIPGNVLVENGMLRLQAQDKPVEAFQHLYPYSAGMVSSFGTFSFTYGYIEMRARMPKGVGLWPAFWLMPASKQWPPEIDVFEYLGKDTHTVYQSVHYADANGKDVGVSEPHTSVDDLSTGFHDYGLLWAPDKLIWYVDGVETHVLETHVPDEPMYVLLTHGIGSAGSWSGAPTAKTVFPNYFEVDYVRVFQPKRTQG